MKKIVLLLACIAGLMGLMACENSENSENFEQKIYVDDYRVNIDTVRILAIHHNAETTIYQLDNRWEVKVWHNAISVTDSKGVPFEWVGIWRDGRNSLVESWQRAKIDQKVEISTDYSRPKKLVEILPVRIPDYQKERTIKKVSKYDGSLSEIDGKLSAVFLSGTSGSFHGESCGSENFFINIYFDEGNPISVNARENPLWLDVEPGDIIIEKMINGLVSYAIKY